MARRMKAVVKAHAVRLSESGLRIWNDETTFYPTRWHYD